MSLAESRELVVTKRHQATPRPSKTLGVIRNIAQAKQLMDEHHLEYPIYVRFNLHQEEKKHRVDKLVEIYGLLTRAKIANRIGDKGKKLFVYRA